MKIFITGGTGFVGRYIVNSLQKEKDIQLVIPTRDINKAKAIFSSSNIKLIHFIEELDYLVKKEKPDIVINLLGILTENKRKGITFEKVHFEYTQRLVEASVDINVKKFIQMSALGVDINSKSRYMKTKAVAEEKIKNSGLNYTIFRPSIIIGKGQKLFEDFKKFSKFMPLFLAPKGKVQPVNVLDVRDCFIKAVKEDLSNQIFELCGDKIISYKELFEFALEYIGKKRFVLEVPKEIFLPLLPIFELLPNSPMTKDQYEMLKKDNVCSGKYKGVKDLLGSVRDFREIG
jgi:NADH dehydrogenase